MSFEFIGHGNFISLVFQIEEELQICSLPFVNNFSNFKGLMKVENFNKTFVTSKWDLSLLKGPTNLKWNLNYEDVFKHNDQIWNFL
jgi:hypothetical protein